MDGKLRYKLILSIVSIVSFFCLIEICLRITNFTFDLPKYFKFEEHFLVDTQISNGNLLKDSVRFWRLAPNVKNLGVNSNGFRNREFSIIKPKNTFRIICLGDSVTYAWDTELEENYARRLEVLLNERIKTYNFEVINAGVVGYTSFQGLKYLETEIVKYQPDLVTVHFGPDDGVPALYFSDKEQKLQPLWLVNLQNLLSKSKFFQFYCKVVFLAKQKLLNFQPQAVPSSKPRVSPEDYKYNYKKMEEIAKKYNFRIAFITPMLYEGGAVCSLPGYQLPEGVSTIDLFPAFRERRLSKLFIDNCHLTPEGHQIAAEVVYDFLIKKALLK